MRSMSLNRKFVAGFPAAGHCPSPEARGEKSAGWKACNTVSALVFAASFRLSNLPAGKGLADEAHDPIGADVAFAEARQCSRRDRGGLRFLIVAHQHHLQLRMVLAQFAYQSRPVRLRESPVQYAVDQK